MEDNDDYDDYDDYDEQTDGHCAACGDLCRDIDEDGYCDDCFHELAKSPD